MLEALLGNRTKEEILLFLLERREGYARQMAVNFNGQLTSFLKQLKRLERGGVLVSFKKGKTRVYGFNPRYPFLQALEQLLKRVMFFMSDADKNKYYYARSRPRRSGKPL